MKIILPVIRRELFEKGKLVNGTIPFSFDSEVVPPLYQSRSYEYEEGYLIDNLLFVI